MRDKLNTNRLKTAMEEKGIRQNDLVELTGINKASISRYVNGVHMPNGNALIKIAKAVGVTPEYLTGQDSEITSFNDMRTLLCLLVRTFTAEQKRELINILIDSMN